MSIVAVLSWALAVVTFAALLMGALCFRLMGTHDRTRRELAICQKEVDLLARELHALGRQGLTQSDRDGIRKLRSPLLTVEDITGGDE